MPARKKSRKTSDKTTPALSLKIETTDSKSHNVNVDDFFKTAEKWLSALKAFALEQGELVTWEIVELKKSSAFIQVQPIKVKTQKPAAKLVKTWTTDSAESRRLGDLPLVSPPRR